MNLKKIILISFLSTQISFAGVAERRLSLVSVIDEQLKEVVRLATNSPDPEIYLRLAQLQLEKARLLKETENESFLAIDASKRHKADKSKLFAGSNSYFQEASRTCEVILKKYPNYNKKGEIYYILAFNAKEYGNKKEAIKYFESASANSKNPEVKHKSKQALAEIFYNSGDFKEAIVLYEETLKEKNDKWWTKDAYNLSWSYLKQGKYDLAVNQLNQVYELSKDTKYVDMSSYAERDMGQFYIEKGDYDKALEFYKKNNKNAVEQFIRVSEKLIGKQQINKAETLLKNSFEVAASDQEKAKINLQLLSLYENSAKDREHFEAARNLKDLVLKNVLNKDQIDTLKLSIQKKAGTVQRLINNKNYDSLPKEKKEKGIYVAGYFELLSKIEPVNEYQYSFLAGETLYSVHAYDEAALAYIDSLQKSGNKVNDTTIKCSEALNIVLVQPDVKADIKNKYMEMAYLSYINTHPNDPKNSDIYQKMFSMHFSQGQISKAENDFDDYRKKFPRELGVHEAMVVRLFEHYKKNNELEKVKILAARLNKKEIIVNQKIVDSISMAVTGLKLESAEKSFKAGKKLESLRLYIEAFNDPSSDENTRKVSSINIAHLFLEVGDVERAASWFGKSLSSLSPDEIKVREARILKFIENIAGLRRFKLAVSLYQNVLTKICHSPSQMKNILFSNIISINVVDGKLKDAQESYLKYKTCDIALDSQKEAYEIILKYYSEEGNIANLEQVYESENPFAITTSARLNLVYKLYKDSKDSNKQLYADNYKKRLLPLKYDKGITNLNADDYDIFAELKFKDVEDLIQKASQIKLEFPDKVYNQRLIAKFKALNSVQDAIDEMDKIGSHDYYIKSRQSLLVLIKSFQNEINNFVLPQDKSEDYRVSFKKGQASFANKLGALELDVVSSLRKTIVSSKIISNQSAQFTQNLNLPFEYQYSYQKEGILMDKRGRK